MATVLVVEDDDVLREVIGLLLRDEGYDVIEVPDGGQAVDWLASRGQTIQSPFVMLLDLGMPVMNGYEVLEALEAQGLAHVVDVIVTTTSDHLPKGMRCLPKPFFIDDLLRQVAEICKRPLPLPRDMS